MAGKRERLIHVEIPATLLVSIYALNKKEGGDLARGIFSQPHNARLLTHQDSDNILFTICATKGGM